MTISFIATYHSTQVRPAGKLLRLPIPQFYLAAIQQVHDPTAKELSLFDKYVAKL